VVLRRAADEGPFNANERAALEIASRLASWVMTMRSKADSRPIEQLGYPELGGDTVPLSRREAEVAELLCGGASTVETAAILRISRRTVDRHLLHIYRKLRITNRSQLLEKLSPYSY